MHKLFCHLPAARGTRRVSETRGRHRNPRAVSGGAGAVPSLARTAGTPGKIPGRKRDPLNWEREHVLPRASPQRAFPTCRDGQRPGSQPHSFPPVKRQGLGWLPDTSRSSPACPGASSSSPSGHPWNRAGKVAGSDVKAPLPSPARCCCCCSTSRGLSERVDGEAEGKERTRPSCPAAVVEVRQEFQPPWGGFLPFRLSSQSPSPPLG